MAQTGVGLCSPRIWAAKRPAPGGPGGCSSRLWGAERPAEPQSEAFSLAACFCPQAKQAHGPVQGQASVQDAHKGRRAAFSGLETKKRRASGGARPGAAEAKASGDPWLTPQALHKGEGGPNSAKRNQPARGGRARRGISQGREPWGISRRAGRKGGNFPEYGNDRTTDPEDTAPPQGEALSNRGKRSLRGWGLWRRVWRLVAAGIRRTKRESPGRQVREFLRREPDDSAWPEASPCWWGEA